MLKCYVKAVVKRLVYFLQVIYCGLVVRVYSKFRFRASYICLAHQLITDVQLPMRCRSTSVVVNDCRVFDRVLRHLFHVTAARCSCLRRRQLETVGGHCAWIVSAASRHVHVGPRLI